MPNSVVMIILAFVLLNDWSIALTTRDDTGKKWQNGNEMNEPSCCAQLGWTSEKATCYALIKGPDLQNIMCNSGPPHTPLNVPCRPEVACCQFMKEISGTETIKNAYRPCENFNRNIPHDLSSQIESAQIEKLRDSTKVVALQLYGLLAHNMHHGKNLHSSKGILERVTLPNLHHFTLKPMVSAGYDVVIFGHTWGNSRNEAVVDERGMLQQMIEGALSFATARTPGVSVGAVRVTAMPPLLHELFAFRSIETTNSLRRIYSRMAGQAFDWVVVYRWDLFMLTPFQIGVLNHGMFYTAHFACIPSRDGFMENEFLYEPPARKDAYNASNSCSDSTGMADFYYAGSPADMDTVFDRFVEDFLSGRFTRGRCQFSGHAHIHGRLQSNTCGSVPTRLGRYMFHFQDYTLAGRDFQKGNEPWEMCADPLGVNWSLDGGSALTSAYVLGDQTHQPQPHSFCEPGRLRKMPSRVCAEGCYPRMLSKSANSTLSSEGCQFYLGHNNKPSALAFQL
eukprot:CAMPEP_0172602736 /NCGR_PEP_ID=MMETSP1068-20121228/22918_1 /TAXON_ID=35684 /ORGANISM="Pseudopedinella elastica, Strain CCMP716" /LENGTH=507 /DNA_ID=CAMNT_0013404203 /DNA_START=179 /DNA_END=1702 /DNA_ORIENTATION=+